MGERGIVQKEESRMKAYGKQNIENFQVQNLGDLLGVIDGLHAFLEEAEQKASHMQAIANLSIILGESIGRDEQVPVTWETLSAVIALFENSFKEIEESTSKAYREGCKMRNAIVAWQKQ